MKIRQAPSCATLAALMAGVLAAPASAEPASGRSQHFEAAALAASAKGDNWMAANFFEHARAAEDSTTNRFNLAVAYELTGRASEAASLYRVILHTPSGGQTRAPLDVQGRNKPNTLMTNDARQRLAWIDERHGEPAPADFEVGASASAFVGGPSRGRVSNARARRLDENARSAVGE